MQLRLDTRGCDVTDLPGLWDEQDLCLYVCHFNPNKPVDETVRTAGPESVWMRTGDSGRWINTGEKSWSKVRDSWFLSRRITAQSPLKPGMVIYVCTDTGPKGISVQSMSVTCSHCAVHIFPDNDSFREWADSQDWSDKSRQNVHRWWMIIGEMHTTGMRVEYHGSESE